MPLFDKYLMLRCSGWTRTCSCVMPTFSADTQHSVHLKSPEYTRSVASPFDFSGSNNRFLWSILLSCLTAEVCTFWVCAWQMKPQDLHGNCCSNAPWPLATPFLLEWENYRADLWGNMIVALLEASSYAWQPHKLGWFNGFECRTFCCSWFDALCFWTHATYTSSGDLSMALLCVYRQWSVTNT